MSLTKQLWIAIVFLILAAFVGSFFVSGRTAQTYLTEQLYQKNQDSSAQLALSVSSAGGDPVTAELIVSAQFDTGHYQSIRFIGSDENLLINREAPLTGGSAPAWLISLFPIEPETGLAYVSNGWQQMGRIEILSQADFAYDQLWSGTKQLFVYFAITAILAGIVATMTLKLILAPLRKSVDQAVAIGERRFIKNKMPRTREFRILVSAMNQLSDRVQKLLSDEAANLEQWQVAAQRDSVTQLLQREPFIERLSGALSREDETSQGIVIVTRMKNLAELNRIEGRERSDDMLRSVGNLFQDIASAHKGGDSGRLNGSELVAYLPNTELTESELSRFNTQLHDSIENLGMRESLQYSSGVVSYYPGDEVSDVLARLDNLIAELENSADKSARIFTGDKDNSQIMSFGEWKTRLALAFENSSFMLDSFQVRDRNNQLIHLELPARLQLENGAQLTAGQFLPWLNRLGWAPRLDIETVKSALSRLRDRPESVSINLSSQLLTDRIATRTVLDLISQQRDVAPRMWLEYPEHSVYDYLEPFRELSTELKSFGCKVGIEHAGPSFGRIGELYDIGLDFVKVDASLVSGINSHQGNQVFLRSLCTIVHSVGCLSLAESVSTDEEWQTLVSLGFDGGTGPHFR